MSNFGLKDSDNLFVTQQKQTYISKQTSSRNTLQYMLLGSGELLINCDRYHADHFRQTSDSFQTYHRLQTDFRSQTPTSDFGPWPDFEHQTSDFGLLTLNFTLQI